MSMIEAANRQRFSLVWIVLLLAAPLSWAATPAVRAYEGKVNIATYEHSARETEPPLFSTSTVTGLYPFTTYLMPYKPGPNPKTYRAIFLENQYLKITHIPEFGGRFFSVYDKLRQREMLYRNDVIKPAPYNPRNSWPQSGMELTGPHDLHMLTLYGEPFWSNKIVNHADNSVSLVLSESDPVYGMRVDLSATLHPGVAAVEIRIFCYNPNSGRKPEMFWINTAINATPKTRFIYPMSRTVGHTTAEIAEWPLYNGVDYSWDRNNKHMLGVFGIDIYDNFQGAYQFDRDYGIFRYADRRVVQGMKLWTFGYGEGANFEEGYTDKAGPYVELQSGRHVWDGHYEWVAPQATEQWSEWWIPVSQTGGLTTLNRDVALNLDVKAHGQGANSTVTISLAATRVLPNARLTIHAKCGEIANAAISLDPAQPFHKQIQRIHATADMLTGMVIKISDKNGKTLLEYQRPDENPGAKEYTPFTKPLEQPRKSPEQMSTEELALAGEYRLKELDEAGAKTFLQMALQKDPGSSRAHALLGMSAYNSGRYAEAISELQKAIERDPYADFAYYYLAEAQFKVGQDAAGTRNLFYIWPESAYFHIREYELGRLALREKQYSEAVSHFRTAVRANGNDLDAALGLAVALAETGQRTEALQTLDNMDVMDPGNRHVQAERWLLTGDPKARTELLRLTGGQTQEALDVSMQYIRLERWSEASRILALVAENSHDLWGTTAEFYYTQAYCERRAGEPKRAEEALRMARQSGSHVDRFPYREESLPVLREAVELDPKDVTAQFDLACLLYFRGRPKEAIAHWEAAETVAPDNFSLRRALGLAYAEQGYPLEKSVTELRRATQLRPEHMKTTYDLANLYARAGRFSEQLAVLNEALSRTPGDDDLMEGILTAQINDGQYSSADQLIQTHSFATRHRRYELRDSFRILRYGEGAKAFQRGDFAAALSLFQSALTPPASLGVDTFASQTSPRLEYYIGRTYESQGNAPEARAAYERAIRGVADLSGDRDSWNSENFFMLAALDRLGRHAEAASLEEKFEHFAETEMDSEQRTHRSEARYLLALIDKQRGGSKFKNLLQQALEARPDLAAARLELRGDVVSAGPLSKP